MNSANEEYHRRIDADFPPVLDVCCGPRMMWFNKRDVRALFVDCRRTTVRGAWGPSSVGRNDILIDPDQIADFTSLPFPDETFWHVVFDPPHIQRLEARGKLTQTFGVLVPGWEDVLSRGFSECFRVLRPGGTLVFKWCEIEIPLARILALTPERPLYGHRSGAKAKTHWIAFLKRVVTKTTWRQVKGLCSEWYDGRVSAEDAMRQIESWTSAILEPQNASVTGAAKPRTVDAVLACPHCGHPAMIEESHPTLPNGEKDTLFRVRCTLRECQASTLDWYPASAAVAAWNRRANKEIT